tara:strand:- start:19 stop:198 length:180 start_codon:yes stop_codon:yes gene_type:complete
MSKKVYLNGYQPKIEYWQYKLNEAVEGFSISDALYAMGKLEYFMGKQLKLNEKDSPVSK